MPEGQVETTENGTKTKKNTPEVETVKMEDGRAVDFVGKKKIDKSGFKLADGTLGIRIDFRNGQTRQYPLRPDMIEKFATHGAEQKYGDQLAGAKDEHGQPLDVEDMVLELDALHKQLYEDGDWTTKRDASGMAGTSILARALAEIKSKTLPEILESLKKLSHKEKMALRLNPKVKPTVDRLEAERAAKGTQVDSDSVLDTI